MLCEAKEVTMTNLQKGGNYFMMRILTARGMLEEIKEVISVHEFRVDCNGSTKRFVEQVDSWTTKPNGVAMRLAGVNSQNCGNVEFFVGNLDADAVMDIMRKLLKDEYCDFSSMVFQKKVDDILETVCDDPQSLPYVSEFVSDYLDSGVFKSSCGCTFDPFSTTALPMGNTDIFGRANSFDEDLIRMSQMPNGGVNGVL